MSDFRNLRSQREDVLSGFQIIGNLSTNQIKNRVVTDSRRIIEQSEGFHGAFASESLRRTGQIKLTREGG